jgi:hypothetical protein
MSRHRTLLAKWSDAIEDKHVARRSSRAVVLLALALLLTACQSKLRKSENPSAEELYTVWPSEPPPDSPFQKSQVITGIAFTARHAEYGEADTWYPSWASNGNMYSPFTDGSVGGVKSWSVGPKATTGMAEIIGDDPMKLMVKPIGVVAASPDPYGGRYPDVTLVYNGVWYYGTYVVDDINGTCGNWCVLGPFAGFPHFEGLRENLDPTQVDTVAQPFWRVS